MIYRSMVADGHKQAVDFEIKGDIVGVTMMGLDIDDSVYGEATANDILTLANVIRTGRAYGREDIKSWIKPMSEAIYEILCAYGLTVACKNGLDEVSFNSVALEIIQLIEVLRETGVVPENIQKVGK